MNGDAFTAYVEKVLLPELAPGTVVILGNLDTHKNAEECEGDASCGMLVLVIGAIELRSQPHGNGVIKTQASSPPVLARAASQIYSTTSQRSAISSHSKSVGTISKPPDTFQVKGGTL